MQTRMKTNTWWLTKRSIRSHHRNSAILTLNQRVQGSSPCAPTIEHLDNQYEIPLRRWRAFNQILFADPMRTRWAHIGPSNSLTSFRRRLRRARRADASGKVRVGFRVALGSLAPMTNPARSNAATSRSATMRAMISSARRVRMRPSNWRA